MFGPLSDIFGRLSDSFWLSWTVFCYRGGLSAIVNVDFADVRTVMSDKGDALMGVGVGTGVWVAGRIDVCVYVSRAPHQQPIPVSTYFPLPSPTAPSRSVPQYRLAS